MSGALAPDEIDVVAAPLPYADDRKRFEGALSRLAGVREVRPLETSGKTHRVRVRYTGDTPFAERLLAMREFQLRIYSRGALAVHVLVTDPSVH